MQEMETVKKIKMKFTKDNFLIMLLCGVLLLVIAWPTEKKTEKNSTQSVQLDSESTILNLRSESFPDAETVQSAVGDEEALLSYAAYLEESLEELLGSMDGVGKVQVMVTLESSKETVVEKDVTTVKEGAAEADSAGGSRNTTDTSTSEQTVYAGGRESQNIPYVKKVLSPKVKGVAVSAQGGGNPRTVQNITEAIQALFGIDVHKIKVVKMIS